MPSCFECAGEVKGVVVGEVKEVVAGEVKGMSANTR